MSLGCFLLFLPEINLFIVVGAVGLWVTCSVIQAPRGQCEALSTRCGKSISLLLVFSNFLDSNSPLRIKIYDATAQQRRGVMTP